jgi:hypothetical protein
MGKSDKRLSYGTILETEPSLGVHLGFRQDHGILKEVLVYTQVNSLLATINS